MERHVNNENNYRSFFWSINEMLLNHVLDHVYFIHLYRIHYAFLLLSMWPCIVE